MAALKDAESDVRANAAVALGEIGAPAVEPLIVALKDSVVMVRGRAAWALGQIEDPRAVNALLTVLREDNLPLIARAYLFFIRRREPESELALIRALYLHGDKEMAEAFLSCGNRELAEAAVNWVVANKDGVSSSPGTEPGVLWGSGR